MYQIVSEMLKLLESHNVSYCHWKSNVNLERATNGDDDLDILVSRRDAAAFEAVIISLGFKEASRNNRKGTSIKHFYGYDEQTGDIVHLHVYHRIIASGAVRKNYRLCLEEMLLQNTQHVGAVRIPTRAAELAVFVIRKMLEHTNVFDLVAFYLRESRRVQKELRWLLVDEAAVEAAELLGYWLGAVDAELFRECVEALESGTVAQRVVCALKMRACLKNYRLSGTLRATLGGCLSLLQATGGRLVGRKKRQRLINGGAVIGIAGPEATGKSTICREMGDWLGKHFAVHSVHVGKPRPSWISAPLVAAIPLVRRLLPRCKSNEIKKDLFKSGPQAKKTTLRGLLFAIRSVMLAYDRSNLLRRVFRRASGGAVVICDRYPAYVTGAMDSPQLDASSYDCRRFSIGRALARLENAIYKRIPPADIAIITSTPVEIALDRNRTRKKKGPCESEDFIRMRHLQSARQKYITPYQHTLDTTGTQAETIREAKRLIWKYL